MDIKNINQKTFKDPRPDLSEDSILWTIFLKLAHDIDPSFYGIMHGMRCQGTMLRKNQRWGHVLHPVIDALGNTGWRSQLQYDEEKRTWLDPYREKVIKLLGKISNA